MLNWKDTGGCTAWFKVTTTVTRLGPLFGATPGPVIVVVVPVEEVTVTGVVIIQRRVKVDPPVGLATPQLAGVSTHPVLV